MHGDGPRVKMHACEGRSCKACVHEGCRSASSSPRARQACAGALAGGWNPSSPGEPTHKWLPPGTGHGDHASCEGVPLVQQHITTRRGVVVVVVVVMLRPFSV